jgi:hypothetical protein
LVKIWNGTAWINQHLISYTYDANDLLMSSAIRDFSSSGNNVQLGDSLKYYYHTLTGISTVEGENKSIIVFPDPVSDVLSVSGSASEITNVEILNAAGQCVYTKYFSKNECFSNQGINVSELNAGVYLVNIFNGKDIYRKKFVKE